MNLAQSGLAGLSAAVGAGLLLMVQSAVDLKSDESCELRVCHVQQKCGRMLALCPGLDRYAEVLSDQRCREVKPISMGDLLAQMSDALPHVGAQLIEGD